MRPLSFQDGQGTQEKHPLEFDKGASTGPFISKPCKGVGHSHERIWEMAKIVVECSDPNDLDAIEEATEEFVGRCNITYFRQAQALQDAGTAQSEREASRIIAEGTGESEETVRYHVRQGAKEVVGGQPTTTTPLNNTQSAGNQENRKRFHKFLGC